MGHIYSLSLMGLMVYRSETQWPPTYPLRGTLLTPSNDPAIPRDAWGTDEWKAYALFLEEAGSMMAKRLHHDRENLRNAMKRLKRGKKDKPLDWLREPPAKKKRGRPPKGETDLIAESVLAIRTEMEAELKGRKITDRKALEEYFARQGKGKWRACGSASRNILNAISRSRKAHKNSRS